ncbi:hypothetical protein ACMFMG_007246 [Clarireedia jacksonii]
MDTGIQLDDLERLQSKINDRAASLFQPSSSEKSCLQICRLLSPLSRQNEGESRLSWNENVCDGSHLKDLRGADDICQLFFIRQDRSWARLNIQRSLFEELVNLYNIFPLFWDCIFAFGRKNRENELNFPRFKTRSNLMLGPVPYQLEGRAFDHDIHAHRLSWLIISRVCTGVYHGVRVGTSGQKDLQSRFLITAPSESAESKIEQYLKQAALIKSPISPWNIHRIIISDSLAGWQDYMTSIESRLWEQTVDLICSGPDGGEEPPPDWSMKYGRRQELKVIEDFVMDLMIIVPTMLDTIDGLRLQCRTFLERNKVELTDPEKYYHEMILREFDEYVKDAKLNVDRARELKFRTESTVNLLSLFLSQHSNDSMHQLTEKSTKDAAAVKILTVITLIYLPTTIVANFFSTQFVRTSDTGHMTLTGNAWILAAVSVPLTAVTIMLWWIWVCLAERRTLGHLNWPHMFRSNLINHCLSTKRKRNDLISGEVRPRDIENGFVSPPAKSPEVSSIGSLITAVKAD